MRLRFFGRLKKDAEYREALFFKASLLFNLLYSVYLLALGHIYSSGWFLSVAFYYVVLTLVRWRFFARLVKKKDIISRIRNVVLLGYLLLLISLPAMVMMQFILFTTPFITYHEITVIALATYTFSTLTVAIISCINHVKNDEYTYLCIAILGLVSSSVSLVTLTNTMLSTFGKIGDPLRDIILPILSAAVSIFIITTAILLIKKANYDLRRYKDEEKRQ